MIAVSEPPLVTLAIAAYNQERFISAAIDGAFSQTYSPLEILVSDDCSTDGTFEIIRDIAAAYTGRHKVRTNRTPTNLGVAKHFGAISRLARGEFIVGAAGDDVSLPRRVEALVECWIASNKRAKSIFSNAIEINENGKRGRLCDWPRLKRFDSLLAFVDGNLEGVPGSTHGWDASLFRVFGDIGARTMMEDSVIPFRALLEGEIRKVEEALVLYRRCDSSLLAQGSKGTVDSMKSLAREFAGAFLACLESLQVQMDRGHAVDAGVIRAVAARYAWHAGFVARADSLGGLLLNQLQFVPLSPRQVGRRCGAYLKAVWREKSRKRAEEAPQGS